MKKLYSTILSIFLTTLLFSACEVKRSSECINYIACQEYYDEALGTPKTELAQYQASGTCWENERLSEICTATCKDKIESLKNELFNRNIELKSCKTSDLDSGTQADSGDV